MTDALLGRTIAQRYRLISRLGAGSVATVYLARHVVIDRLGAIKIVRPELLRDPMHRERFLREARAVNRINHPNIVEITDYGEADGLVYLVMEYVPGESLERLVEAGPLGWKRAAAIGLQIASALGRAHQMGIVHRDLKPANILVVRRGSGGDLAKLTDFGVAKLVDAPPITLRSEVAPEPGDAPAPAEIHEVDAQADLFELGAVLYQATSGKLPYPEADLSRRPAPLAALAPDTPSFFDEVVATLLAPDPRDRPRDAFEAADLLRRVLEQESVFSAPISSILAASDAPGQEVPLPAGAQAPPAPRRKGASPLAGLPFERLAGVCAGALADLEARVPPGTSLDEARRLCTTVEAVSDMVQSDSRAVHAVEGRGRATRAELGKKLDELARERSKALGWAGTIAERSYLVAQRRLSGEVPVPAVEAMVWEQAALEQEEDLVRDRAEALLAQMRACQGEIERHAVRLEHELLVVNACLEGRIAALRTLAFEAWLALDAAAARAGVPRSELGTGGQASEKFA